MTVLTTEAPVFVAPYRPEQGGTDFLGIRQVNFDLMDECLPGFNNVSSHVRPFSLISWIYWKFYHLAAAAGIETATSEQLKAFQEKAEILFTWGHILEGVSGIPGTDSRPPKSGRVALDFESWGRIPSSTSLMAAVQYGPSAKTSGGLGFIEPVLQARGMYRTTGLGIEFAEALEASLGGRDRHKLLATLSNTTATESDARELFPCWSILTPTAQERNAFRRAFFDEATDDSEALGRRSSTVKLVLAALKHASRPLTEDEVRSFVFHNSSGRKLTGRDQAAVSWHRWIALQVRQAQRLAMEAILYWVERRLNQAHDRDTNSMIKHALKVRLQDDAILPGGPTVADLRRDLFPKAQELGTLLASSERGREYCLFELMQQILATIKTNTNESFLCALRILYICAEFTDALQQLETVTGLLRNGGAERISLAHWRDFLRRCAPLPVDEFLRLLLEQYVISQHLSVAARRFDGGTQRLRITIEEQGLTPLITKPSILRVTPDGLGAALSLMAECGMIQRNANNAFSLRATAAKAR